jgi:hypothetical protein
MSLAHGWSIHPPADVKYDSDGFCYVLHSNYELLVCTFAC